MRIIDGSLQLPGAQIVQIDKLIIHPSHAVNVREGSAIGPPNTHHIQVVIVNERTALQLPCGKQFLRNLRAEIDKVLGDDTGAVTL